MGSLTTICSSPAADQGAITGPCQLVLSFPVLIASPALKVPRSLLGLPDVWKSGQDVMRVVKTCMLEILGCDVKVFLDIDDLTEIGDGGLEGLIQKSAVIFVFATGGGP